MASIYTRKSDGKTTRWETGSGTNSNLTLTLSDPTLTGELTALAQSLGHVKVRGVGTGEGSMSALMSALGQAVRAQGVEAVARQMRFVAYPKK